jgi:membrane-bound lytic murein transglycosylase B
MKTFSIRVAAAALSCIAFAGATTAAAPAAGLDITRPEVQQFIAKLDKEHGFDRQDLVWVLRDAAPQPRIVEIMERPAEGTMAWHQYRARFLGEERINGGVAVWKEHRETLEAIERDTGVPAQYLVAITGVETLYGRQTGGYRVLDALSTLAFDYPRRATYFQNELTQFLLLMREERMNPREPKGSYAGAMGVPQFMPSSYRSYAVDGNGDGHRDLWTFGPDVFASIAHYFKEHGWRPGEPVLSNATNPESTDDPAKAEARLADTVESMRKRGYAFDTTQPDKAPAMLVPAMLETGNSWRIGYQNFYTITRYNRSFLYAMAVNDLADAIAARYRGTEPARSPAATAVRREASTLLVAQGE